MIEKLIAFIIFTILSPIVLVISILVLIRSKSNPIFTQKRVGQSGRLFKLYKFKTLKNDTPQLSKEELSQEDYVIPSLLWLRKSHLDELPQLVNIIKGDMVFFGYRPSIPKQELLNILREKNRITKYKPGVTGWGQVNYINSQSDQEKINFELEYYENQKKFKNRIVLLTLRKMFYQYE